tara:strand:+ start:428 stop:655 length:228 start_codon:yes stop_codon:yes gene_type:complete
LKHKDKFCKLYKTSTKEGNNMTTSVFYYGEMGEQVRDACDAFIHSNEPDILKMIIWCQIVGMDSDEIVQLLKEEL